MSAVEAHVERASAKLTTHLHITGIRDDGYHLIDAEMVSLDLEDELVFTAGDGLEIVGPEGAGISAGSDNLVAKALRLASRSAHVRLDKRIPHGGGLGGGSSDAAAVLRWAGVNDLARAASIGADVPFCLSGGRARVRGIGEIVEPLPYEDRTYTLVVPPFGVNTAAVYSAFDELRGDRPGYVEQTNHLEEAAMAVEPRLAWWRDALRDATGKCPVLAGSGSTWFFEGTLGAPDDPSVAQARWFATRTMEPIPLGSYR